MNLILFAFFAPLREINHLKMRLIYFFLLLTISNLIFATDYAKQEPSNFWLTMQDNADWTPKGLQNLQDSAKADVFFIHPTN